MVGAAGRFTLQSMTRTNHKFPHYYWGLCAEIHSNSFGLQYFKIPSGHYLSLLLLKLLQVS